MTIPDHQSLMLPVLRLAAEPGERRVAEVADRIADDLGLSAEERAEMLPSGRQRALHNRIHWAEFYMSKAGLIASPARGRFVSTEAVNKRPSSTLFNPGVSARSRDIIRASGGVTIGADSDPHQREKNL